MTLTAPEVDLYHSPKGLYDFQAMAVAYGYEYESNLFVYDTGIGKSHIAMATSALLYTDDAIDVVLLVAEKNKLQDDEWPKDFRTYTNLTFDLYWKVPPAKREAIRKNPPQVLLSTYETIKSDAAKFVTETVRGKQVSHWVPGPLTEDLLGKRVLVIYDEMTKLGNRTSGLHKAHETMLKALRKAAPARPKIMGLTATPIESSVENHYNLGRLLQPERMPTVAEFERDYVLTKDFHGNYVKFRNLTTDDCEPGVVPFVEIMRPVVRRKRKTDPDVIDQFPKVVEEPPFYVPLGKRHAEFYEVVESIARESDPWTQRSFTTVLRQIAGHPMSLLRSEGAAAQTIVSEVGEEGLRALGNAKGDAVVERLNPLVNGQGALVVVFTYFANSILPLLYEEWSRPVKEGGLGVPIAINAPFLSDRDRAANKEAFRRGEKRIFLTSDAGARGINLPEALYVYEYEMALTHSNRTQRFNRIHRIDSEHPSVTFGSYVALDTIEEGLANNTLKRNEWSDKLLDDDDPGEEFITAVMRKKAFQMARKRAAA